MSDEQLNKDITNYTNWLSQFEDCPECDGVGTWDESDCCGAKYYGDDEHDGICGECGDHCAKLKCDMCNGTGTIKKQDNWWDE